MEAVIRNLLEGMAPGEPAQFGNLGVVPLFPPGDKARGPKYITLAEALEQNLFAVTEVSQGGSVTELKVANRADRPVLILDGEELVGAKQNRIVNASILVPAKSEIVIPVSCTEQGRWNYVSASFRHSGHVMAQKARAFKSAAVSANLSRGMGFRSDQGQVWQEVEELSRKMGVNSPSAAMTDVFKYHSKGLEGYLEAFPCRVGQAGLAALIGGRMAGLDFVSRPEAYLVLHPRLVRSYALEAMADDRGRPEDPDAESAAGLVAEFIRAAAATDGRRHRSEGLGWDWRLEGGEVAGAALVHRRAVIHTAFFRREKKTFAGGPIHRTRRYRYPVY